MSYPKVSVITPSFNQGQFIEETILSVINQDYLNFEYIIIDGGSTDDTVDIIKKYEKHLAYWVSETDTGQSEAINKGFKKSTGDILCWINSDDVLMPHALNTVVYFFQKNPHLHILNGYTVVIDKDSCVLFNLFMLKQKIWYAKHGIYYIAQPSLFWKRSVLDAIGLLREDFHLLMDKELLIRMLQNSYDIGQVKKILAAFRVHQTSKTYLGNNKKLGLKEKELKAHDLTEIDKSYGKEYTQDPKLFFKLIYGLEKLLKGAYTKSVFFSFRWKGKNIKELHSKN